MSLLLKIILSNIKVHKHQILKERKNNYLNKKSKNNKYHNYQLRKISEQTMSKVIMRIPIHKNYIFKKVNNKNIILCNYQINKIIQYQI